MSCECVRSSVWWVLLAYSEEAGELPTQSMDSIPTNATTPSQQMDEASVASNDAQLVSNLSKQVTMAKPKYR